MTVNPFLSQQQILARFRLLTTIPIFEGNVPDGEAIPMTGTKIKPHLVINFAGLTDPPKRVNGITGAADDSFMQTFSTHAIAGDDNAARAVHSIGWGQILGFIPDHCGEIRPAFFAGVGEISSLSQPTRFSAVQSYKYLINS